MTRRHLNFPTGARGTRRDIEPGVQIFATGSAGRDAPRREVKKPFLAYALGALVGLLLFQSTNSYPVLDWGQLMAASLLVSIPVLVVVVTAIRRSERSRIAGLSRHAFLGIMAVVIPIAGVTGAFDANGFFDTSPPETHRVLLLERIETKKPPPCVAIAPWREGRRRETVCGFLCARWPSKPGHTMVEVVTHRGWLGFERIVGCEIVRN